MHAWWPLRQQSNLFSGFHNWGWISARKLLSGIELHDDAIIPDEKLKTKDEDDEAEDLATSEQNGPTEEECKKYVSKACLGQGKKATTRGEEPAKHVKTSKKPDGNDKIEERTQAKKALPKEVNAKKDDQGGEKSVESQASKASKTSESPKAKPSPASSKVTPKADKSKEAPAKAAKSPEKASKVNTKASPPPAQASKTESKAHADGASKKVEVTKPVKKDEAAKASEKNAIPPKEKGTKKKTKDKKVKKPKLKLPKSEIKSVPDVHKIRKVKPPHTYNGKYLIALGHGGCRGDEWNDAPWPKFLGRQTLNRCASKCAQDPDCTAIHVLRKEGRTYECLHFDVDHDEIVLVQGLGGACYKLDDELPSEEDDVEEDPNPSEHEEEGVISDGDEIIPIVGPVLPVHLGHGLCRGHGWTNSLWPIVIAPTTQVDCANKCAMRKGCTAFDISRKHKNRFLCILYGHIHVEPASAVPGECFTLQSRMERALGRIVEVDEAEEKADDAKNGGPYPFWHLGQGMCRGTDWATKKWPKLRGKRTLQGCADACGNNGDCTAFDVSERDGDLFSCLLYGHTYPRAAIGVPGDCYAIESAKARKTASKAKDASNKGANDASVPRKAKDKSSKSPSSAKPKSNPPQSDGAIQKKTLENAYELLGKGRCRGPKWQGRYWPKATEAESLSECAAACASVNGCTAFDIGPHGDQTSCFLFGHRDVRPASGVKGHCYHMTSVNHEKFRTKGKKSKKKKRGDGAQPRNAKGVTNLLGKGACRGSGWQDRGWPKLRGSKTLEECGKICLSTQGCTAFHVAPEKANQIDCILFGHKSVVPASGVPGDCYVVTIEEIIPSTPSKTVGSNPKTDSSNPKTDSSKPKTDTSQPKKDASKAKNKIPKFDPPKVVADEDGEDDDEWLFEPPPPEIRSRDHISTILGLNDPGSESRQDEIESTLKQLKKVYEHSIKPLETTFKYRELSNRHFGDPEIFNKPLVVLMGPWSGGKSTMINYLLGTEFTKNAFKATAEPSKGFHFNIAMHGDREEELEGTELAAEWAFSSLQKFGQEFLKKLKGKKMPNKLLESVTFAEIPGVLETGSARKIDRRYPFNDACQWFIDHADLILLIYDYAKLDIGPETEALLDQLKGRESQVRIILNKADEITAEELLKIQSSLVWNVSPLMASLEPPIMYAGSFWSKTYKAGAPKRLLKAQENALLTDIREAIDQRVENRIATARRFAVRVRNHAKMVDCYLTTYYNQKGLFSDKSGVAQAIINHPEKYHIYEGISTMTNISRYDLPDPQTYKVFFNLHSLYDFPSLQSTCTFFRGCPINKLDTAIAYDLPELLTAFKRKAEPKGGR
eukprot:maker-scaffold1444_size41037-snap-gene-0.7 protein:Tk11320 transcript:maker-scaffold1444_size41037-snap-gene-0.7-mRNA-1 annotation:"sarcalumenin isoform x2"